MSSQPIDEPTTPTIGVMLQPSMEELNSGMNDEMKDEMKLPRRSLHQLRLQVKKVSPFLNKLKSPSFRQDKSTKAPEAENKENHSPDVNDTKMSSFSMPRLFTKKQQQDQSSAAAAPTLGLRKFLSRMSLKKEMDISKEAEPTMTTSVSTPLPMSPVIDDDDVASPLQPLDDLQQEDAHQQHSAMPVAA
ncbi:hypothetical protein BC940DRAFT_363620 [Gongronella butleri]|nr:hypothetical protein BC940DRAFT_363620 [Gongronella butleri]